MTVRDDRGDVKQTTTGFRGPLMVQSLTSAKSKFLSLTNLPVILDPSHAMGYRYGIPDLSRACVAMGIDGLLIESHPCPEEALSDASQQLNFAEFGAMQDSLRPVAAAVGRRLV